MSNFSPIADFEDAGTSTHPRATSSQSYVTRRRSSLSAPGGEGRGEVASASLRRSSLSASGGQGRGEVAPPLSRRSSLSASGGEGWGEVAPPSLPLRFSLTQHLGYWTLTHGAQTAILKHEIGLSYVAYLMDHPDEPIHGLALALKIRAMRNGQPADSAELIQERALALDDAEAARRLFRKQLELEQIADDDSQPEPVKEEALRQLEAIYTFQKKNISRTSSVAQKASDAVGKSLKRLRARLAKANSADGSPNQTLRAFAHYIRKHILTPSGRAGGHGGFRPPTGCGGLFIHTELLRQQHYRGQ